VASGSTDVLVNNIDFMITCGDTASFGIVTANLGTESPWGQVIAGVAGTNVAGADAPVLDGDDADATNDDDGAGTWSQPNAETLAGAAFTSSQELTAGTVFKFDIDLDKDYLGTAGSGPCASLSGVGETLQLKMIVDGGGTTISELSIDSVVSGKAVV
jgi:hypothetical protein